MKEYVLFSPIGGTDPISNCYDGALLHICRVYTPKSISLYLSGEICEKHEMDNRYLASLDYLSESLGVEWDVQPNLHPEHWEVHQFDVIIPIFHKEIRSLIDAYPETMVLLNLSSGTPAMKSALYALSAFYPNETLGVQVSTPEKRMNEVRGAFGEYDVELSWEMNLDNTADFTNRCEPVVPLNLLVNHKRGIVQKLIHRMDYHGAYEVAEEIIENLTEGAIPALKWAAARYDLNYHAMVELDKQYGEIFPLPQKSDDKREVVEYLLSTKARLDTQAYVDFLRALTPLVLDLFERILANRGPTDPRKLYRVKTINGKVKEDWDEVKLNQHKYGAVLYAKYPNFIHKNIYSGHLELLLEEYCSPDKRLMKLIKDIRTVEAEARNTAAHEMTSVNAAWIEKITGLSPIKIMDTLIELAKVAGLESSPRQWESYSEMNDYLCSLL